MLGRVELVVAALLLSISVLRKACAGLQCVQGGRGHDRSVKSGNRWVGSGELLRMPWLVIYEVVKIGMV